MDPFYLIVLSIVVILLILALTYIGMQMTSPAAKKQAYPPVAASCPDYWQTVSTDPSSCLIPVNTSKNTGKMYDASGNLSLNSGTTFGFNNTSKSINFADKGWNKGGSTSVCSQKSWANQFGIVWDGVSNYNSC
jgi:hypothetical protein